MKRMMFMKRMIAMMAVVFSVAMFASCSDDDEGNGGDGTVVEATGVTLDQPTLSLSVGENATLLATVAPENATNQSLEWGSDNEAVATVDTAGVVTGVADGTATITVTITGTELSATCEVTVSAPVPQVGDIYYSDGTFSASFNEGKTPIGVIFYVFPESASVDDPSLAALFPEGLKGLVVSLDEWTMPLSLYLAKYGSSITSNENFFQKMLPYGVSNLENTSLNTEEMVGYNNTLLLQGWNDYATKSGLIYEETYYDNDKNEHKISTPAIFESADSVAAYNERVVVPEGVSPWYIPSYAELEQIITNRDVINTTLTSIDRNLIVTYDDAGPTSKYWSSTNIQEVTTTAYDDKGPVEVKTYNTYFHVYNCYRDQFETENTENGQTSLRYVFAF